MRLPYQPQEPHWSYTPTIRPLPQAGFLTQCAVEGACGGDEAAVRERLRIITESTARRTRLLRE